MKDTTTQEVAMNSGKDRFQVITWQRGSHGIVDTAYPIGHPRHRLGIGFKRRRDAERDAARRNREAGA